MPIVQGMAVHMFLRKAMLTRFVSEPVGLHEVNDENLARAVHDIFKTLSDGSKCRGQYLL